jgi:formylglycine-generating enzyme required for sulfatase activity
MGVVAADAERCAQWLGGKLPLPIQWDKAAGRFEEPHARGPFVDPYDGTGIGVGRTTEAGPLKRGAAVKDIAVPFGCRDMAGNGYEWLGKAVAETLTDDLRVRSPLQILSSGTDVYVRGRPFTDAKPLQFRDLTNDYLPLPGDRSDARVGFRVVLEP